MAMMRETWPMKACWRARRRGQSVGCDRLRSGAEPGLCRHRQFGAACAVLPVNNEGDNLFVCSIVALDAETGEYRWHYQMNPGEEWDWTCTQSMISADLEIDGRMRKVLMQAPKNGFFYVLDRATGEFIQRRAHVFQNWNEGFDAEGRPITSEAVRYGFDPAAGRAGAGRGAQLVPDGLQPAHEACLFPGLPVGLRLCPAARLEAAADALEQRLGRVHRRGAAEAAGAAGRGNKIEKAWLTAWDPVANRVAWQVELPRHGNGGVFVTASDLVFAGTTKQTFAAFDARTGRCCGNTPRRARRSQARSPTWSGRRAVHRDQRRLGRRRGADRARRGHRAAARARPAAGVPARRHGAAAAAAARSRPANPPPLRASEAQVGAGQQLFAQTCAVCHGQNAIGGVKDLRHMTADTHAKFNAIVLDGISTSTRAWRASPTS
jgi:quinohemoprotein ethanol dehydrogenase